MFLEILTYLLEATVGTLNEVITFYVLGFSSYQVTRKQKGQLINFH